MQGIRDGYFKYSLTQAHNAALQTLGLRGSQDKGLRRVPGIILQGLCVKYFLPQMQQAPLKSNVDFGITTATGSFL